MRTPSAWTKFLFQVWPSIACLVLLLVPVSASLASPPTPAPTPAANPMEDVRLKRTISLDEIGTPLYELLRKLSNDGLVLTCARDCQELKLQIHLKQRPLSALMAALAELTPGAWEPLPDNRGYRLEMEFNAISRRKRWWELFLGERERALAAQRDHILQTMRSQPYRRKPGDPNPENSDPAIEARVAAEHDFFRLLPAALQEKIAGQINDSPYYSIGSLSFGTDDEEGPVVAALSDLPPQIQERVRQRASVLLRPGESPFLLEDTFVNITNGGFELMASIALPDGRWTGTAFSLHIGTAPEALPLVADQRMLAMMVQRLGKAAPQTWKQLAAYQQSRFWQNDPPDPSRRDFLPINRSAILQWLSDKAGLEFVSDYYARGGRPMNFQEQKQPLKGSLKEELDFQAVLHDISWKKRPDNIYLFRNNRWYRDDYLEVPSALLRRWLLARLAWRGGQEKQPAPAKTPQMLAEQIRKQMDWEAEVVSTLTRWQITVGMRWFSPEPSLMEALWQKQAAKQTVQFSPEWPEGYIPGKIYPFSADADRILQEYRTIGFYAGLDASARAALTEGRLPFASLTPGQQQQALFLLPRLRSLLHSAGPSVLLGLRPRVEQTFSGTGGAVRLVVTSPPFTAASTER